MQDLLAHTAIPSRRPVRDWGLAYGFLLLLAALASPRMEFPDGLGPLFWLPSGVALGALLRSGPRTLPGLALGLQGAYLLGGVTPGIAFSLTLLDMGLLLLVTGLMQQFQFDPYLRQRRDGWLLLGIGVIGGSLLLGFGQYLLFPKPLEGFATLSYGTPLGLLLGALPVLAFSRQKLQQLNWPSTLIDWGVTWALPTSILGWGIITVAAPTGLPASLVPVLGMLWMVWFILDRGQGSAVVALLLTALLFGWLLAAQNNQHAIQIEGLWALLISMGVLACAVAPLLAELRNRDKRVRLALDGTQTAIWDLSFKQRSVSFSPGWLHNLGYPNSPDGISIAQWEKMIHPDDRAICRESLKQHLEGESPLFRQEFRLIAPGQRQYWFIARGSITERNCQGQPQRLLGTLVDITAQKTAQHYLRLLERALHSARDAVAIIDLQHPAQAVLFANPALERITGYDPKQILGHPLFFFSRQAQGNVTRLIDTAVKSGESVHGRYWLVRREGSGFWSHLSISPVRDERDNIHHCIAIFSDVSAEVEAQERLKERDALLQKLTMQVPGLIFQYCVPRQGRPYFPYLSKGLETLFGLQQDSPEEDATRFFTVMDPNDRRKVEKGLNQPDTELGPWREEFRVQLGGREFWREGHAVPERQANGDILWHGYIRDISEQVHLMVALGESEARFRAIANAAPMLIWQADAAGRCVWFNQAWYDFTGQNFHYELEHCWLDEVHPEEQGSVRQIVADWMQHHQSFRLECRLRHRDGQWRWVINQGVPRLNDRGECLGYIGVCMDIDEQKRVELALRQSQENLRQMGLREEMLLEQERKRIASQVHDELGQLLTALKMGLSALRLRFKDVAGLSEQVQSLNNLSAHAFRVVRQVTRHLRPQALDHGLRPALEWLARETHLSTGLPVRANCPEMSCQPPDEISTALFRLAQEGVTNILKHAQANQAAINLSCKNGCLILKVSDDGQGFNPETVPQETGYGLLGMRERAISLGGSFEIDSKPGQGTTLCLSIPVEKTHDCHSCHCCR